MTEEPRPWWENRFFHWIILVIVPFAAIAPTLTWLEFRNGMENVNVATALEAARDGHWLLPTINGAPRTKKPPLAQWVAAAGILSSDSIEWGARWPSLLMACLTLAGVYELGRIVGGVRLGLIAGLVCASAGMFLIHSRHQTYDIQLLFWVTLTNVFLARGLLLSKKPTALFAAAGICLGLALLTKGPVALTQTILPVAVFAGFVKWKSRRESQPVPLVETKASLAWPIAVGVLLALLITLPWPIYIWIKMNGRGHEWVREVALADEKLERKRSHWYDLLVFIPIVFPWSLMLLRGFVAVAADAAGGAWARRLGSDPGDKHPQASRRMVLMVFLMIVPMLVLQFFPPRRERYLVPMLGPAAVIAAWGIQSCYRSVGRFLTDQLLVAFQWLTLAGAVAALLWVGCSHGPVQVWKMTFDGLRSMNGQPWYTPTFAVVLATVLLLVIVQGLWMPSRGGLSLAVVSVVVMLTLQWAYIHGFRGARDNHSVRDVALRMRQQYQGKDPLIYDTHITGKSAPIELGIYMNRVVAKEKKPEKLPPSDRLQVFLVPESATGKKLWHRPAITFDSKFVHDGTWWYVFEMPPKR